MEVRHASDLSYTHGARHLSCSSIRRRSRGRDTGEYSRRAYQRVSGHSVTTKESVSLTRLRAENLLASQANALRHWLSEYVHLLDDGLEGFAQLHRHSYA